MCEKSHNSSDFSCEDNLIAQARHSVLIAGHQCNLIINSISGCLSKGVKVLWFGSKDSCGTLSNKFLPFVNANLMQLYVYESEFQLIIIDGVFPSSKQKGQFFKLSKDVQSFNSQQYLVEHSQSENIMVEASAGTGKTRVMIDRVMYLLQVKGVDPSQIGMITFTGAAAIQMGARLQDELIKRLIVTHDTSYLLLLEKTSAMTISTIDSFILTLLKKIGVNEGFSNDASVSSFNYALSGIVDDCVDDQYFTGSIEQNMGLSLPNTTRTVRKFYRTLVSKGFTADDIRSLDWGPVQGDALLLQRVLKETLGSIGYNLSKIERRRDSVPLGDSTQTVVSSLEMTHPEYLDFKIKYLFIDEFQDTNNIQISIACMLSNYFDINLFVVGDQKQSIYRFRGADDSAFDTFKRYVDKYELSKPDVYELVNNYRTSSGIIKKLNPMFEKWAELRYLPHASPVVSSSGDCTGSFIAKVVRDNDKQQTLVNDVHRAEEDLRCRMSGRTRKSSDCVAILTRTNKELDQVADILLNSGIHANVKRDRPFFLSDAVRDFYDMICSYVFRFDQIAVMNYLNTPYSSFDDTVTAEDILSIYGNDNLAKELMTELITEHTSWSRYESEFRMRPVLSVIRDILRSEPILENYTSKLKRTSCSEKQLGIRVKQYQANLEKLLAMLYGMSDTVGNSIFDLYEYLRISISTNREELEVECENDSDATIQCMTVHGAKGLEFDTVILPFDRVMASPRDQTELILSENYDKIGWRYYSDGNSLKNDYYDLIKQYDTSMLVAEETRVLYVAMTRTVHNLIVYMSGVKGGYSWSKLIQEGLH